MHRLRTPHAALVLILLVTSLIVLPSLGQDMWTDEARTLFYAGAAPQYGPTTIPESLERISDNLWQAPGYYLVLWGWGRLVGWSLFALRLPSLIFGLCTIVLTYDLARQHASRRVALYAAFLLAFGAYFLNFFHDMRAYTLLALLTTLMLWSYTRLIRAKTGQAPLLLLFVASIVGLLYTHFFAVFPIAALGVCHLLLNRKHRLFWPILAGFVIGGVLFLPWVQVFLGGAQLATEVPRKEINLSAVEIIQSILYFSTNAGTALGIVLLTLVLGTRPTGQQRFFVLWLIFGGVLLWGVTRFVPALTDVKYMLFLWPALAIVFAYGIEQLHERGIQARLIVFVWCLMFGYSVLSSDEQTRIHPWYRPPFQELSATLTPLTAQGDAVLFVDPSQEGYVTDPMLQYSLYESPAQTVEVLEDGYAMNDRVFAEQASAAVQNAQRVWLTYDRDAPNWRTDFLVTRVLPRQGFHECSSVPQTPRLSLSLLAREPVESTQYSFQQDAGTSVDVSLVSSPVLTEDHRALLVTGTTASAAFESSAYSLAIHLEDAQAQVVGQSDVGIAGNDFQCQAHLIDMQDLPTGHYTAKLTVYNWQTGERLQSVVPSSDQRPAIGSVVVPER